MSGGIIREYGDVVDSRKMWPTNGRRWRCGVCFGFAKACNGCNSGPLAVLESLPGVWGPLKLEEEGLYLCEEFRVAKDPSADELARHRKVRDEALAQGMRLADELGDLRKERDDALRRVGELTLKLERLERKTRA